MAHSDTEAESEETLQGEEGNSSAICQRVQDGSAQKACVLHLVTWRPLGDLGRAVTVERWAQSLLLQVPW